MVKCLPDMQKIEGPIPSPPTERNNMKILICLALLSFVGCGVVEIEVSDPNPKRMQECYQCDNKECPLDKFDGGLATLAWYECPDCGAEMIYRFKDDKWGLYSYERGDER